MFRQDAKGHLGPGYVDDYPFANTEVGEVNGLAVSGSGGDVLRIQATLLKDKTAGPLKLERTGRLADVMRESTEYALTYILSQGRRWGMRIPKGGTIHVHAPAGAIPKDGPSGGVTMVTTYASLLAGRRVKPGVAMTGEVDILGSVMPVGGVDQKVLGAHRRGMTLVFIPKANENDIKELAPEVLSKTKVVPVSHVSEILDQVLEPKPGLFSRLFAGRR